MPPLAQDLRYAFRLLARAPGFTAVAATVLALGIGANSAIFSVVDAALLRPLPWHKPAELTVLWEHPPGYRTSRVSPLNFQDWHDQNRVFSGLAAIGGNSPTLLTPSGPEQIPGQSVTSEFFGLLGIAPLVGRTFTADDDRRQASVVMLGEKLWRSRFGADPNIAGRAVTLSGKTSIVVGVVPAGFQFLFPSDIWTLFTVNRSPEQRRMHYLQVIGRLKPGVSMPQAESAMAAIARHIAQIAPGTNKGWGITIDPLRQALVGSELRATSLVLGGVVAFVLLMACANVANLMLARGAGRAREMAVRVSLGAPARRLMRQLLTESLLLAVLGGIGGLALAWALIRVAPALIPAETLPVGLALRLDARIVAFTSVVTLATGLLFGLVPAWTATTWSLSGRSLSGNSLSGALRGGGRGATSGNSKLLGGLAMAEIAIAVVVVAGAGLFLRTLDRLSQVDPGFHAGRVLTMHMILPLSRYPTTERLLAFYNAAQQEIEAVPGVQLASFGGSLPLTGWDIGQGFQVVGDAPHDATNTPSAHYQIVGARYFETLGIPLQSGRAFDNRDNNGAPQVAIVNQEFVRRYLPGRAALGTHIRVSAMDMAGPKSVEREIVGVSGQVKVNGPGEEENIVEIYVPVTQNPWCGPSLVIRAADEPLAVTTAITAAVKAAIGKVDKELAVTQVQTMDEIAFQSVARPRFRARLLAGFAALALLLAAVGVFGVLAFAVAQRKREFGIRMALGAQMADVLRLVLTRGIAIAAGGIAAGLLGAAALARSLTALLFGVPPLDPVAFGLSAALLASVAVAAAAIPAWRAARVDPAIALREEG
jgi:putative ABC transport system permease protein